MSEVWEEKIYSQGFHNNRYPFDRVVSNILTAKKGFKTPLRALDLGSGTGNHLKFFAENGFDTTGIEQSESAIKMARNLLEKHSLKAEMIKGNIMTPNRYLGDKKFSVILDRGSLTHNELHSIENALDELEPHLAEDGIFLSYMFSQKHPSVIGATEKSKLFYTEYTRGIFKRAEIPALFIDEKTIHKIYGQRFQIQEIIEMQFQNRFDDEQSSSMYEIVCKKGVIKKIE